MIFDFVQHLYLLNCWFSFIFLKLINSLRFCWCVSPLRLNHNAKNWAQNGPLGPNVLHLSVHLLVYSTTTTHNWTRSRHSLKNPNVTFLNLGQKKALTWWHHLFLLHKTTSQRRPKHGGLWAPQSNGAMAFDMAAVGPWNQFRTKTTEWWIPRKTSDYIHSHTYTCTHGRQMLICHQY